MKLRQCRRSGFGWITSACVIGIVLLLNAAGAFKATDHVVHDWVQRLATPTNHKKNVLLVNLSNDPRIASQQFEPLLERVLRYGPKRIGVVDDGMLRCADRLQRFKGDDRIVVGQSLDQVLGDANQQNAGHPLSIEADFNDSIAAHTHEVGFSDLHLNGQSLYRNATSRISHENRDVFSFEAELARPFLTSSEMIPNTPFGIRYEKHLNSLPNLTADEILNGNVISELVENKIILIGAAQQPTFGLVTPMSDQRMSRLEVRGHIVETLLQRSQILPLGLLAGSILIALTVLLHSPIPRQFRGRWFVIALVISVGLGLLLSMLMLIFFSRQIPVSAMLIGILLSFATILYQRFQILNSITDYWRLMMEVNRSQSQAIGKDQVWQAVTDSVYQMFYPNRMALLELKPGSTHLKIVKTLHCEPSQIHEQRRDIQRTPYKEVLEQNQPANTSGRSFFDPDQSRGEAEYMIPLVCQGETLGIVVLAMDRALLWHDFKNFLEQFFEEVSQLVAENRVYNQKDLQGHSLLWKLQTLPEQRKYQSIEQQKRRNLNQSVQIEQAFESSESALAICDIFGHVKKRNSKLVRFLQDAQIKISSSSCVDMLASISGQSIEECRRAFRRAIIEERSCCWSIAPDAARPTPCQMHIKPIQLSDDMNKSDLESRGVSIEIVDGANFALENQWQDRLAESNIARIESRLARIQRQARSLQMQDSTEPSRVDSINDTINDLIHAVEECRTINHGRISEQAEESLEFDTRIVWDSVQSSVQPRLEEQNIKVATHFSDEPGMAIANPILLGKVFHSIMEIMIENALDESEIFVGLESTAYDVHYRFQIQGNTSPLDGFRNSIGADEDREENSGSHDPKLLLNDNQLDRFNEVKLWLEEWDGTLRIRQAQDFGMLIELSLMSDVQSSHQSSESVIRHSNLRR